MTGVATRNARETDMAGRPKNIWLALVNRVCINLVPEGVRVQMRLELDRFPDRVVNLNLTVAEARKWADALNHFADKVEKEYGSGK